MRGERDIDIVIAIILTIFLIITALIVASILIPIKIAFNASVRGNSLSLVVRLTLLSGGLKLHFLREKGKNLLEVIPLGVVIHRRELKEAPRKPPSFNQILRIGEELPQLREPMLRLISKFVNSIHLEDMNFRGRIGSDDPSSLGVYYGIYSGFMGFLSPWISRDQFYFEPDFSGEVFEGNASAELRITQHILVIPILRIVTKKPFRRAMKGSGD